MELKVRVVGLIVHWFKMLKDQAKKFFSIELNFVAQKMLDPLGVCTLMPVYGSEADFLEEAVAE
jgi:hypothetical protein